MPYANRNEQLEYLRQWRIKNPRHNKVWSETNRKQKNDIFYRYTELNRQKNNARQKVYYAVKTGKLVRPDICSKCGSKEKIEADHADYSKSLDVVWLCYKCHLQVTVERRNY